MAPIKSVAKAGTEAWKKPEWKKNRGITYLISPTMKISINGYQMNRIMMGATSLPFSGDLFALGVAHTVAKVVKGELGDVFNRERDIPINDADDCNAKFRRESHTGFVGPRYMLHPNQTRVIILKQTRKAEGATPPKVAKLDNDGGPLLDVKDEVFYVHCLYDHENICFVTPTGNCLYVCRNQIMVP